MKTEILLNGFSVLLCQTNKCSQIKRIVIFLRESEPLFMLKHETLLIYNLYTGRMQNL